MLGHLRLHRLTELPGEIQGGLLVLATGIVDRGGLGLVGGDGLTGGRGDGLVAGVLDGGDRHRLVGRLGRPGGRHHLGRCGSVGGCLDRALDNHVRIRLSRGLDSGGRVPGPARGGGAGLGRRGCGRVDDGLAGAVVVRLSTGRRGALRSRYLDPIGLITLADRYGALLLDGGRGGSHRRLNHRRRRHCRRSGHLTVHESLIHGEGLDEEGLTRRSGDRLGLGWRGRLLAGVCRRARGRVPGTDGRALRLRGGDRCDDLGLGGDGLLDLPLLRCGLRYRLVGDRLTVRLGRGVLDGLGHRSRGGLLLSRLSRHVLACWSGLRSRPVSGSIGLRESRLGDRVS